MKVMKRYIAIAILMFCAATLSVSAQVVKEVEVTKDYAPEIGTARKMDVAPNMVDTITLHPEIDYTITPRSFALTLGAHKFNPAKVTYWEYNRNYPFYLKLGAGYSLNTVGDLYATTHRADVGYLTGYINHYAQYSKLSYTDYISGDGNTYKDNRSMQMNNKFGVMGGKYIGRYTLAGDASYSMDTYHRYPLHNFSGEEGQPALEYTKRKIGYDNLKLALSFGDSFADYSRINFKVYGSVNLFNDKSHTFIADDRYMQTNVTLGGAIAREINKRSALSLNVDYEGYYGMHSLKSYKNSIVGATLMYRYRTGGLIDMKAGVKVLYDKNPADEVKSNRWHAFPYLTLSFNINDKGCFVPYVEVDGELQNNSYYSLVRRNPYVAILGGAAGSLGVDSVVPNTELYNVRFGVSGHTASSKLAYRFYANMSFMTNALYWYNINQIFFGVESANRNVWSLCGAVDYKPISQLLLTAQIKGSLYTNFSNVKDAAPPVEAMLSARYSHKKFTVGLSAELYGATTWTYVQDLSLFGLSAEPSVVQGVFNAPAWIDLSLYADWHVRKTCAVFLEANNLLGEVMPKYRWAVYREMGTSFTIGAKVQF